MLLAINKHDNSLTVVLLGINKHDNSPAVVLLGINKHDSSPPVGGVGGGLTHQPKNKTATKQ